MTSVDKIEQLMIENDDLKRRLVEAEGNHKHHGCEECNRNFADLEAERDRLKEHVKELEAMWVGLGAGNADLDS